MRLLHTGKYSLVQFQESDVPLYAILSHRWGSNEIALQDVDRIHNCVGDGYDKIRGACATAKAHGFDYIWIDTCCIDKTSSAELSEAINSMYRWYQLSAICYAYLSDVSADSSDQQIKHFKESEWFMRGWTLQELVAPTVLIFLDREYQEIGTKSSLGSEITEITGIPIHILRGGDIHSASIAQRMSWASKRKTTRTEDLAYCLMGIFDINMPMLYGEGEKAFARLQEEIIKTSDDHTIFAWKERGYSKEPFVPEGQLAPSPAAFAESSNIIPIVSSDRSGGAITISNKGIELKLRITSRHASLRVALLPCGVEGEPTKLVAIYLSPISETNECLTGTFRGGFRLMSDRVNWSGYIEKKVCIERVRHTGSFQSGFEKAVSNGQQEILKLLLNKADGSVPKAISRKALQIAAEKGQEEIVKLLLDGKIDVSEGALDAAITNRHKAIVMLLLKNHADPGTALATAVFRRDKEIVKLVQKHAADHDIDISMHTKVIVNGLVKNKYTWIHKPDDIHNSDDIQAMVELLENSLL
jgi:hypothetical protein